MFREIRTAFLLFVIMILITGLAYPALVTSLAHSLFADKASGSLIEKDGKVIGSVLIGQQFTKPECFHPRPSSAGSGYDASASSSSNLSQTSIELKDKIAARYKELSAENPGKHIPEDLLTSSASGLDPDISPEAALFQAPRIAKARKLSEEIIVKLVNENTQPRIFGIFGEPRVNVLMLNLKLDMVAR